MKLRRERNPGWLRVSVAALLWLVLLGSVSCAPLPQFPYAEGADLVPPRIVGMGFQRADLLSITFDEPCSLVPESLLPGPTLASSDITTRSATWPQAVSTQDRQSHKGTQSELVFVFSHPPEPARQHVLEAQVEDQAGNHLRFVARFHGLNELLPAMVINEFTTQGSATHPDFVEIRMLTDGNLAGACIYEGVPGDWSDRLVFPELTVRAGDFVVVHFRPEGIDEEVNETVRKDHSGGRDASDAAWDFWVEDGDGLSGNNGTVTLCENPLGGVLDAILYSNRTRDSDERYRGFGSGAVMARADYLVLESAWSASGTVYPEDAVDPEDSTATRSICRSSGSVDTNSREDWHITPTRGLTPGGVNSDEVYVRSGS